MLVIERSLRRGRRFLPLSIACATAHTSLFSIKDPHIYVMVLPGRGGLMYMASYRQASGLFPRICTCMLPCLPTVMFLCERIILQVFRRVLQASASILSPGASLKWRLLWGETMVVSRYADVPSVCPVCMIYYCTSIAFEQEVFSLQHYLLTLEAFICFRKANPRFYFVPAING